MITLVTVVGARPQFIKAAIISRLISSLDFKGQFREVLVHTGQHFDASMSSVFFEELELNTPDYNLDIHGSSHGSMTGAMLPRIEEILLSVRPDLVLIYGDTNSTLAAALAAAKLEIPIAHVESGLRTYMKRMPEEQNRIIADHLSSWLFCPTDQAITNLKEEGIFNVSGRNPTSDTPRVLNVGDVMYDASVHYREKAFSRPEAHRPRKRLDIQGKYRLMTLHRAENTDDLARLSSIVGAINRLDDLPFVFPVHPRTRKQLQRADLLLGDHVIALGPLGYLDMIDLEADCEMIVTDSGGVQKEAFFFRKPCVNVYENSGWVEAVDAGWIVSAGVDTQSIVNAVIDFQIPATWSPLYGDGRTGQRILNELASSLGQ